ncbi:MAG: CoA ester lyase [Actinomycetota bacterium]
MAYTTAGDVKFRARRSCLSVPASSPKMLGKAPGLPADEIFMDLEDSVAPAEKEGARKNVVAALKDNDYSGKTVVLRINGVYTHWCYRDIIEITEQVGDRIDCIMIPKVQWASDVTFVADLLRMIEETNGFQRRVGLEAQIENAQGLTNIDEIAAASDRLETLIFGPGDMAAAMGMPHSTVGQIVREYPGDHWHWILMRILVAARNQNLQAIDGPFAAIRDLDGFREIAMRSRQLGYDGKWALNPDQIPILNEIFTPSQKEYDHAEDILEAYQKATEEDRTGAVMFGEEMIDEASRKMAAVHAAQGRAAGLKRSKS